jgi:ankyrin repeat protein
MRLLLDRGADPNARDRLDRTAAMQAVTSLQLDLVEPLLDAGSDPNAFSTLGVSLAYGVASALEQYQNDQATRDKLEQIRDRIIAMGVKWPPMDPLAMRDWMRSQGMQVVVPAGHER